MQFNFFPVWIYTQSNITIITFCTWLHHNINHEHSISNLTQYIKTITCLLIIFQRKWENHGKVGSTRYTCGNSYMVCYRTQNAFRWSRGQIRRAENFASTTHKKLQRYGARSRTGLRWMIRNYSEHWDITTKQKFSERFEENITNEYNCIKRIAIKTALRYKN